MTPTHSTAGGRTGIYCHCANERVPVDRCYQCGPDDGWLYEDDRYEEPPLYPTGKIAGMTDAELSAELDRQCDRQGRLGDADYIDDRAVEQTEARCRLLENEIKHRAALKTAGGEE